MEASHFFDLDVVAFVECVDDLREDLHVEQWCLQVLAPCRHMLQLGSVFGFERAQGLCTEASMLLADAQCEGQPFGQAETPQQQAQDSTQQEP